MSSDDDFDFDAPAFVPGQGFTPHTPVVEAKPAPVKTTAPKTTTAKATPKQSTTAPKPSPQPKPEVEKKVEKKVEEEIDPSLLAEPTGDDDKREHLNIVFIGHVDAGKSTCSGQILYLNGQVDERTVQKYTKEANDKNRGSWWLAYILDTIEEERAKGKTVEVGRAHFETDKKRYTILDAPGHKNFVPNMIVGVSQADFGILIISARKGEFESGFEKNGQTREHALLARTLGVKTLMVAINKMDDPTVEWDKERYDAILGKLGPYLKGIGFRPTDIVYLPISGLSGTNIKVRLSKEVCPWFDGQSLIETLDNLKPIERNETGPLRIPVLDKYRDMGALVVLGKVESGKVSRGDKVVLQPGGNTVEVLQVANDWGTMRTATPGENVMLSVRGIDEENIHKGFVLCDPLMISSRDIVAKIVVLELVDGKPLWTPGSTAVFHAHTGVEEVIVTKLLLEHDKKGQIKTKNPKFVKSDSIVTAHLTFQGQAVPLDTFKECPQLGRFTLRDEGKTIAFGMIMQLGAPKLKAKVNSNA